MSTYNLLVTASAWTKLVDADDTDFLVTWAVAKTVEFASTELDAVPTITGHHVPREKEVTRETVGAGFVWARLVPDGSNSSIQLTVSKTKSASGATGGFDINEGVHKVATMIWNPTYLHWERSTGSTGGSTTNTVVPTTKRFDKRSDLELYVGSAEVGTVEASSNWAIQKITFDTDGNATGSYYAVGVWLNRYVLTYV